MTLQDLKKVSSTLLSGATFKRVGVLLIVALGVVLVLKVTDFAKRQAKEALLMQAIILSSALDEQQVAQLTGKPEDVSLPAYANVAEHMHRVKKSLPDARFVYLLKMVNQQVIFIADSEPPSSTAASAYGEVYTEASTQLRNVFVAGTPLLEGPLVDRWGSWISVHAPIYDHAGKIIALASIDMSAEKWERLMHIYQFSAMILTLLLLGLLLLSIFYFLGMSHWQAAEQKVRLRSIEDTLTGLPNRLHITSILQNTLQRSKRNSRRFAVMFLDLNGLKTINDELGHAAGDALLCEIATRIRLILRASDQVGRLGGDEFVVIIEEILSQEDALHVARKIQQKISEPLVLEELRGLVVSASIGIAYYPEDGNDVDTLLSYADEQMYEEKKHRYSIIGNPALGQIDPSHGVDNEPRERTPDTSMGEHSQTPHTREMNAPKISDN